MRHICSPLAQYLSLVTVLLGSHAFQYSNPASPRTLSPLCAHTARATRKGDACAVRTRSRSLCAAPSPVCGASSRTMCAIDPDKRDINAQLTSSGWHRLPSVLPAPPHARSTHPYRSPQSTVQRYHRSANPHVQKRTATIARTVEQLLPPSCLLHAHSTSPLKRHPLPSGPSTPRRRWRRRQLVDRLL